MSNLMKNINIDMEISSSQKKRHSVTTKHYGKRKEIAKRHNKLVEMYENGLSFATMASEFNTSTLTLKSYLVECGIHNPIPKNRFTWEEDRTIMELLTHGESHFTIAKTLNRTMPVVRQRIYTLRRNGMI